MTPEQIPIPKYNWPICPDCRKTVKEVVLTWLSPRYGSHYTLQVTCCTDDQVIVINPYDRIGETVQLWKVVQTTLDEYENRGLKLKLKLSRKSGF